MGFNIICRCECLLRATTFCGIFFSLFLRHLSLGITADFLYVVYRSKSHFQAALGIGKKTTHDAQNENPSQSRHPPDGEATQTTTASTPPADLPLEDQPDPSASSNSSQHALSSSALSHPPPTSHPSLLVPSTNDQVLSFISPSISSSLPSAPSSHSLPIPPSNPSLFQTTSAPDPVSITNANPNTHVKSVRAYKRRPPKNLPCPVEGCPKVYKQKTGLMYHLEHVSVSEVSSFSLFFFCFPQSIRIALRIYIPLF